MSVLQGEIFVSSVISRKEHSEYLDSSGDIRIEGLNEKGGLPKGHPKPAHKRGLYL